MKIFRYLTVLFLVFGLLGVVSSQDLPKNYYLTDDDTTYPISKIDQDMNLVEQITESDTSIPIDSTGYDIYSGSDYIFGSADMNSGEDKIYKINKTDPSDASASRVQNIFAYRITVSDNYVVGDSRSSAEIYSKDTLSYQSTIADAVGGAESYGDYFYTYDPNNGEMEKWDLSSGSMVNSFAESGISGGSTSSYASGQNTNYVYILYRTDNAFGVFNTDTDNWECTATNVDVNFDSWSRHSTTAEIGNGGVIAGNTNTKIFPDCSTTQISSSPGNAVATLNNSAVVETDTEQSLDVFDLNTGNALKTYSSSNSFRALDYSTVLNGTVYIDTVSLQGNTYRSNIDNTSYEATVQNYDQSGTFKFIDQYNGVNTTIYSSPQDVGTVTHTFNKSWNDSETGTHKFYTVFERNGDTTTDYGGEFEVVQYKSPEINLENPKDSKILEWNYQESNTCPSSGEGICHTMYSDFSSNDEASYQFNISAYNDDVSWTLQENDGHGWRDLESGTVTGGGATTPNTQNFDYNMNPYGTSDITSSTGKFIDTLYNWRLQYSTSTEGSSTTSTREWNSTDVNQPPEVTNYNVDPHPANATPGDLFDISIEGTVGDDLIKNITYKLDVTNEPNPDPITVQPDYQDANSFNDQQNDAFEYLSSYDGEQVTVSATVTDEAGRSTTVQRQAVTEIAPDRLILNNPPDGESYLTPEGSNTVDVTFDWGVETSTHGGTAELVVDGSVVDTQSVPENTESTFSTTEGYSSGDYDWKVRFTDGETSEVYESGTRSFSVSDTPFNIVLNSPKNGNTIELLNESSTDVKHDFKIDARATNDDFYYEFILKNASDGSTIESRTSNTLDFDQRSFEETVSGLGGGSYDWTVEVYWASDDTLQESKTTSYNVEDRPMFDLSINEPLPGEQFELLDQSSIDVPASYDVTTYKSSVYLVSELDNSEVDSRTVSGDTSETVSFNLTDLDEGQYTFTVSGTDGEDRTETRDVSFSVVQESDLAFRELETYPDIGDAKVGDSPDIYFEGVNQSKVEQVELDIIVNGSEYKTIVVPAEDIQSGSFYSLVEDAIDITKDLLASQFRIEATVLTVAGETATDVYENTIGKNREPAVGLESPADGKTFEQVDGNPENIRYRYTVSTVNNPVDYTLFVEGNAVETGTINEEDTSLTIEDFKNNVDDLGLSQFGTFEWRVEIDEQNTGYNMSSPTRTYTVINETDEPVLNLDRPQDGEQFTITGEYPTREVPLDFGWNVEEPGTVKVQIGDGSGTRTVFEQDVNSGGASTQESVTLGTGTYTANLSFNSENYFASETYTFAVDKEVPNATVSLREPSDGSTIYKDVGTTFSWRVANPDTNGSTYLQINDSGGSEVERFSRTYNTQNEIMVFRELFATDISVGQYEMTAYFDTGSQVLQSETWTFTVDDITKPETTLDVPEDGDVYEEGEGIGFNWTTQTFEESTDVSLQIVPSGDYEPKTYLTDSLSAYTEQDYTEEVSDLSPGEYTYFVEMDTGGNRFKSSERTFNVEADDVKDPKITTSRPRQDERFEVGNNSNTATVPFNYSAKIYTETDAEVRLRIEDVESDKGFKTVNVSEQNIDDGNTSYYELKDLDESGYRYRVVVEHSTGDTFESETKSFAVGEADVPISNPSESLIDRAANLIGQINNTFKAAVGSSGQFFAATLMVLIMAGGVHLAFKVDILTTMAAVLLTLAFSLADGYFPVETFYIVLAVAAFMAAKLGASFLGGGD